MTVSEMIKHKITGEPRLVRDGQRLIIKASHRLPSSGDEMQTALRIVGALGAATILVAHYRPEVSLSPDSNVLLDNANTVIVGLLNAFGKLSEIADQQTLDVPLQSLRGWLLASAFLGGTAVIRYSGLFDLYTWLTNREHVTVTIDDEHMSMRRGKFGLPRRIKRASIKDVLILANHRAGHDVMVQHDGGLSRVASIYGDLTRPTLMRLRIKEALADMPRAQDATFGNFLRNNY